MAQEWDAMRGEEVSPEMPSVILLGQEDLRVAIEKTEFLVRMRLPPPAVSFLISVHALPDEFCIMHVLLAL